MSKISLASNGSGTGIFTIASPATNTNRTLTLPDTTGTLFDSTGATTLTDLTVTNGASIQGLTVGRGAGAVSTNTALGASALAANTTGTQNSAFGYQALLTNITGANNTAIGEGTLQVVTVSDNTAVGSGALRFTTTGAGNSSLGRLALFVNTTGSSNVAVGTSALQSNTTASNNTAVGYQAGYTNTTGTNITAIGYGALYTNNANNNTALGKYAGYSNTTGNANVFVGSESAASGYAAGYFNTTGSNNVAVGANALANNTTGPNNTAVGYQAGYTQTTGNGGGSVFVGYRAGYSGNGYQQTIVGVDAGLLSTGSNNTLIGMEAGSTMTSGTGNSILGRFNGNQDGLDIRTLADYIVLSDGNGARQITMKEGQTLALDSAVPNAGTGITFPATQSASSNANTLDDYEEGTWTPSFTLDSGSATASSNTGSYIKIGRQVTVTLAITFSVPSAANVNDITGFPFTVSSLSQRGVGVARENVSTGFAWLLRTNPNVTTANLRRYDNAQALTDAMQFLGSVTYFTD